MDDLPRDICKEQLAWTRRRLEALDRIEIKLKEMRELAMYAASRALDDQQAAQVQEWINILQAEVQELDKATCWVQKDPLEN